MNATHFFHGVTIPGRASKFSVWFKGDPLGRTGSLAQLVDGERIDRAGRSYALTPREIDDLITGPWTARQAGTF